MVDETLRDLEFAPYIIRLDGLIPPDNGTVAELTPAPLCANITPTNRAGGPFFFGFQARSLDEEVP
jgi:hypothetical protein